MSTDPKHAWRELYERIDAELRPYVQDVVRPTLVARIISEYLAAPGWRPPLRPAKPFLARHRAERTLHALLAPSKEHQQ